MADVLDDSISTPASASSGPPPQVVLLQLLTGRWVAQALGAIAKMGVADHMSSSPTPVENIADAVGANTEALYRVLRALSMVGVTVEHGNHAFSLTPVGETLRTDMLGSMRWMAAYTNDPWALGAWSELEYSIRTGKPGFDKAMGMKPWDYLGAHPEEADRFNKGMTAISAMSIAPVPHVYDFTQFGTIADIGGGFGLTIATILRAAPAARGILFDQPHVVSGAPEMLQAQGVADRVQVVGGSFFEAVPAEADAYILKHIIHDWDDEHSQKILHIVRSAMPDHAKVLLLEWVVPGPNEESFSKWLDLEMLTVVGGKERDPEQFRELLASAGLRMTRIVPTPGGLSVIEAVRG